jgi:hypothetical protein
MASSPLSDPQAMLAAHVQFELDRWRGDAGAESLSTEVRAWWAWASALPLRDVLDEGAATAAAQRVLCDQPVTDELYDHLVAAVRRIHAQIADDATRVDELVDAGDFERLAAAVGEMTEVRTAIIEQITTSEVYSRLISHVLYNGIKSYVTSENLVTKRVPGASSLMKLGSSALGSAAPGLGKGIDRQLGGFVNANIAETMRDSQEYLQNALTPELIVDVAREVYGGAGSTKLSDIAELVPPQTVENLLAAAVDAMIHARSSDSFRELVRGTVAEFYDGNGSRPVGELIGDLGISRDGIMDAVLEVVAPVLQRAVDDGFLETRVRERLAAFYDSLSP